MGNLIIKGKGGAGNKLILQDQAGGAVLTTADSGASLGTISGGTLASGVVFPAGHVLQIQTSHLKDVWTYTNSSAWDWGTATTRGNQSHGSIIDDLSITVTAKGTNSDFYLLLNLDQVGNSDMDGGYGLAVNIYSSADTYANPVDRGNQAGNRTRVMTGSWMRHGAGEFANITLVANLKHTGASIAKGATISYRVAMSSHYTSGGNTLWINKYNTDADAAYSMRSVSTLQVTEVAT